MATVEWDADIAAAYDATVAERYAPDVLDPTVELLAELAGGGRALELAIGTGRVALPLAARGVEVHGIELSPAMLAELRGKPGAERIHAVVGDMTSARVDGQFALVYLVFNTICNVTTQDEQVAVFANAARHLAPGGHFVLEVGIPQLRRLPVGERGRVFDLRDDHVGVETFDDPIEQISWSHHWWEIDGRMVRHAAPYRFVWPAELDLMARLAGLVRRDRWAGWRGEPFGPDATNQVVVYQRVADEP